MSDGAASPTPTPDGKRTFKLIVISDINCPWCYIGQRALFAAIDRATAASIPSASASLLSASPTNDSSDALALASTDITSAAALDEPTIAFDVEYRPFCLKPDLTNDAPVDKAELMIARFGQERFDQVRAIVAERAAQEGIKFTFKGPMTQTTRAHRLLLKAWQTGGMVRQQALLNALFKAYCEEEKDVGNFDVLAGLADSTGLMGKGEALKFLASDECATEVQQMIDDAQRKGISGVPFVIIEGKWAVSGGQTSDVYYEIFQKLVAAA